MLSSILCNDLAAPYSSQSSRDDALFDIDSGPVYESPATRKGMSGPKKAALSVCRLRNLILVCVCVCGKYSSNSKSHAPVFKYQTSIFEGEKKGVEQFSMKKLKTGSASLPFAFPPLICCNTSPCLHFIICSSSPLLSSAFLQSPPMHGFKQVSHVRSGDLRG